MFLDPEVQIPLDSLTQFPANFGNSDDGSSAPAVNEGSKYQEGASFDRKDISSESCKLDAGSDSLCLSSHLYSD